MAGVYDVSAAQGEKVDCQRHVIVNNSIGIDNVLFGHNRPGNPAQMKRCVEREHAGQMAEIEAAKALVVAVLLGYGL
ncbi:hypothetical protein BpHYR1_026456 [Brachionus plicatilis]|uniref:Uncharacterized protein n=1 Tax=Brachionus plicatilis TaxID=10195 RepID=A0A3M7QWR0_BRAPC|nr:hypothetical protein BpHYR1_026456 [Brachionus plicatilis]